jgi:hypothetical protein
MPLAGVGLHYLQYCLGLRDLGVEVSYLEDNGAWPLDPRPVPDDDPGAYSVAWLREMFGAFDVPWAFVDPSGRYHGATAHEVRRRCAQADLVLNVSGSNWMGRDHRAAKAIAYVDTDSGFTQIVSATDRRFRDVLESYDLLFTFAEALGSSDSRLPADGLPWKTTRQPVWLPFWEEVRTPPGDTYTTVMNWHAYGVAEWNGEKWGQKDAEFHLVHALPNELGLAMELAVAGEVPQSELEANGWRLSDPYEVTRTIWRFRDYIAASRGELTVAKQAYVRSRCGWFSERSANYLAAGRPVVAQDTGWSAYLPTGAGLFPFSSTEEAADALRAIEADVTRHSIAARDVARTHFDASVVLGRLLSDAGVT